MISAGMIDMLLAMLARGRQYALIETVDGYAIVYIGIAQEH